MTKDEASAVIDRCVEDDEYFMLVRDAIAVADQLYITGMGESYYEELLCRALVSLCRQWYRHT